MGLVIIWFLLSTKRVILLTKKEAETLWKIHKQQKKSASKSWLKVMKNNKIMGFECELRNKHLQKKHTITINV